ncbi:RecA-superfamily ATPase implicated in signal transduction [Vulgatibacter incomptus]|uniref:RecA-superfamily ATPase implicated in signal transduction n=1 Tax=Vulgatibacter incomptus TaxID=1391653 RepID=A0A0K1PGE3_9BACT|nr:RecA-superfamily ATPase implicated in signal transduction [Vulgatibacter incomptus]
MEAPAKNPFRPGVGIRPPYLAGREASLRRFDSMLRAAPEQPANMRLTGLRGVGKTVLLQEFADRAAEQGWVAAVLELGPSHNTDAGIAAAVSGLAEQARLRVSRIERVKAAIGGVMRGAGTLSVTWSDVTLAIDPAWAKPGTEGIAKTLFDLCEFAVGKGMNGVTLLLDEAQVIRDDRDRKGEHPLSILVSAVVAIQKQMVPLGMVLCGLPTLTGNLLKARSYTERMFRAEEIGSLAHDEARRALAEPLKDGPIRIDDSVVERVVDEVEGYPYFVQLWGAELWDTAFMAAAEQISPAMFDVTSAEVYRRLDLEFYDPRISTLTPAEQQVLLDTAFVQSYPPLHAADIKDVSDKSSGNINVLLGRMVESGVIYRVRMGQYDYTAPKFRQYLLRRARRGGSRA